MDPLLEKNFISTKDAGSHSGYTSDYLARLARSGKIVGKRVGNSWLIENSSLTRFLQEQKNRKIEYARTLADTRTKEYAENIGGQASGISSVSLPSAVMGGKALALTAITLLIVSGTLAAQTGAGQRLMGRVATVAPQTATAAALSAGEQAALSFYNAVNGALDTTGNVFASLFGSTPMPSVLTPTTPVTNQISNGASTTPARATSGFPTATSAARPPAATPIINTVQNSQLTGLPTNVPSSTISSSPAVSYPTYTTVVQQGVSQTKLDQALIAMKNGILGTLAGMIQPVANQGFTNMNSIQMVNRIQKLDGIIVTNGDFQGGTLTDISSISGTTATFTNITASGTITPGIVSADSYITAPYFTAASTTAASIFSGSLAVGTSTPFGNNLFLIGTSSPLVSVDSNSGKLSTNGDVSINGLVLGLGAGGGSGTDTAFGFNALAANTTGFRNTAIGQHALEANTGGIQNTAIGRALEANTTGSNNTAIGRIALLSNTIGSQNVAVGNQSLQSNIYGDSNIAIGYQSLMNASSSQNIALGFQAGNGITTGNYNVLIGANSGSSIATLSNYMLFADGQGNERFRVDNNGNIGIGTTNPGAKLEVNGTITNNGFFLSNRRLVAPQSIINQGTGALTTITTPATAGNGLYMMIAEPTGRFVYAVDKLAHRIHEYSINQGSGALTAIGGSPIVNITYPIGGAADPTGRFVYISNNGDGTVSQYSINQSTGALTSIAAAVAAGNGPSMVAVDPTGRFAYVTNQTDGTVSEYSIDQSTGALTSIAAAVTAGTAPTSVAADPSGRFVYVVNLTDSTVSQFSINQSTGALTAITTAIAAGGSAITVAVDPTGRFVYVANVGDGTVSQYSINQSTGALTSIAAAVASGGSTRGIVVEPAGKFVYATNSTDNTVSQFSINQTTGALTLVSNSTVTGSAPNSIAADPMGRFIYVGNYTSQNVSQFVIQNASAGSFLVTGSLGIGTSTPPSSSYFTVGTSSPLLYVDNITGLVGIGTANPTRSLDSTGMVQGVGGLSSGAAVEKSWTVSFPQGVANQKVDIFFPASQRIAGTFDVTIGGGNNFMNARGGYTKQFGVLGQSNGTLSQMNTQVIRDLGTIAAANEFSISDFRWDSTNLRWRVTISNLATVNTGQDISITFKGYPGDSYQERFKNVDISAIYTTDTSVIPADRMNFNGRAGLNLQPNGGNVGIGTSSPLATFDVAGSLSQTTPLLQISKVGALYATSTALIVDSSGKVGIGTTNLNYDLNIAGASSARVAYGTTASPLIWHTIASASAFSWTESGVADGRLVIKAGGGVGIDVTPLSELDVNGGAAIGTYAGVNAAPANGMIVSGSVGIGTNSPTSKLEVNGDIRISSGSGGRLYFADGSSMFTSSAAGTGITSWNDLNFQTGGILNFQTGNGSATSTKMEILNNGNVGIGVASPTYKLDVSGLGHFTGLVDAANFVATSTATSTFAGGIGSASGNFTIGSAGTTNNIFLNPYGGKVGIGMTSSPRAVLNIGGGAGSIINGYGVILGTVGVVPPSVAAGAEADRFEIGFPGYRDIEPNNIAAKIAAIRINNFSNLYYGVDLSFSTGSGISGYGGGATFHDTSHERMRITNSGFVGIGTQMPGAVLDIAGANNGSSPLLQLSSVASSATTTLFIVTNGGSVGIGTTTPWASLSVAGASTYTGNPLFTVSSSTPTATTTVFQITSQGNVGIGTAAPTQTLDVAGNVNVSSGSAYMYNGSNIVYTMGTSNYFFGNGGNATMSGTYNTGSGYQTLIGNTSGSYNTADGMWALRENTTGTFNVAVGAQASVGNRSGGSNTAVGVNALFANTTGGGNTVSGTSAFASNVSATSSVAVGYRAAYGPANYFNQGGTYIGYQSGYNADNNSDYNTLVGYQSGYGVTTGSNNIWIGTATSSTAIANLTTGSQNILIGNNISLPSATNSGQLNIGNIIFGTGNTGTGSTVSTGNIGIGTTTPYAKLSVMDTAAGLHDVFSISSSTTGLIFKVDSYGNTFGDGAYSSPAADYAEYFYTRSTNLKSGEIVCIDPSNNNAVMRCERGADNNVMGIVSTRPSVIGNHIPEAKSDPSHYSVIGMMGQVEAYVSAENGPINVGDSLTSASSTAGYAMRASGSDSTVGIALEPLVSGTGQIKVLISRRNKSLAVEEVESLVVERIANMKIEDRVQQMIKTAVDTVMQSSFSVSGSVAASAYTAPLTDSMSFIFDNATTTAAIPSVVLTADGKGVNLYKLATYDLSGLSALAAAVDAQSVRITALEERMTKLESGTVGVATTSPVELGTSMLTSAFESIGGVLNIGKLMANTLYAAYGFFDNLTAANATIGSAAAPSGVTFYDTVTKAPYCFSVANGAATTTPGACATAGASVNPFTAATSTATALIAPITMQIIGDNPVRLPIGGTYMERGASVFDKNGTTGKYDIYVSGFTNATTSPSLDTSVPTTYILTYVATDSNGNNTTVHRAVIVGDTAPVSNVDPAATPDAQITITPVAPTSSEVPIAPVVSSSTPEASSTTSTTATAPTTDTSAAPPITISDTAVTPPVTDTVPAAAPISITDTATTTQSAQ